MDLQFTKTFSDEYLALADRDVGPVDEMLDRLQVEHEQPHMRDGITVGSVALFATPRFDTPGGTYRITWLYNDVEERTIVCMTVARTDITRRPR